MSASDAVETKIRAARIKLLIHQPFFGSLSLRLVIMECNTWCKTMATDGKHLYYNRDFISSITLQETQFAICHEILHCAFEHFNRQSSRNREIWNMATDYAINWILKRDQIGTPLNPNPKLGIEKILLDEKYADMPSEEIYEKLLKSGAAIKKSFDVHIYVQGSGADSGKNKKDETGDGSGNEDGDGEGPPKISKKDADETAQDFRDALIDAAENSQRGRAAGTIPGEIIRLVNQLKQAKINWRELLHNSIQSTVKSDVSFMRPSKRSNDCYTLPGRLPEDTIKIGCAIDVSGSIGEDQIVDFVSEIYGIMTQYPSFVVYLWCFDTRCQGLEKFTEDNAEDLLSWKPVGGGGTCIASVFDFIKEKDIDVDAVAVFTDLEDSSQNHVDAGNVPDTIWVIHNPYNRDVVPPFGVSANYQEK